MWRDDWVNVHSIHMGKRLFYHYISWICWTKKNKSRYTCTSYMSLALLVKNIYVQTVPEIYVDATYGEEMLAQLSYWLLQLITLVSNAAVYSSIILRWQIETLYTNPTDPGALGLALLHRGLTFINAYYQAATNLVERDWRQYRGNNLPRSRSSALSEYFD